MYNSRYEFKDYLENFILSKAKKPLRSLDLYFCGRKDLCIQSIELNGMHQDFQNDHELYEFLSTMMFSPEEINQAEHFLAFLNIVFTGKAVGIVGFEPTTPCSQSRCSTKLSYIPKCFRFKILKL